MDNEEAIDILNRTKIVVDESKADEVKAAFEMAIDALSKQTPKRPLTVELFNESERKTTLEYCPSCKQMLHGRADCIHCGQKIDWR